MPRQRNSNRGRRARGPNRGLRRGRRARNTAPADPRPFTPIKWQPLVIEFDLQAPSSEGWGAFNVADLVSAFQVQTGTGSTVNIDIKCRKMDVWLLDNTLDLSAIIYNLTPVPTDAGVEVAVPAKQLSDVAGKNHWAKVRLPWTTKDRQQALNTSSSDVTIGAVYFPTLTINARVRVSILWRFASQGSTPQITVQSKFMGKKDKTIINNHTDQIDTQSLLETTSEVSSSNVSSICSNTSDPKIKKFSLQSIVKHSEKTKPRFFAHKCDSPNYAGTRRDIHYYVEFDCGACGSQQRIHLDGMHGHHRQIPVKIEPIDHQLDIWYKRDLYHECALKRERKKTIQKKQRKQTARSIAWSQSKSGSQVNPSDSVSNVQFNALVSEIASLKRIIESLRPDTAMA